MSTSQPHIGDTPQPSMQSAAGRRAWLNALMPPAKHDGEGDGAWTDRIASEGRALGKNRQCSIGWHDECSDPEGHECRCVCHMDGAPSTLELARWLAITWDEADAADTEVKRLREALELIATEPAPGSTVFCRRTAREALDGVTTGGPT